MKRILFSLFSLSAAFCYAQFEINTVDVTTNDLVYDANTKRIYVSIPSAHGSDGNSIGVINPLTHELETTVFMGSEPTFMAIADNGQYIYTGFDQTSTVRRFDVATQTAGLEFSLGADDFLGPYFVEDIEVMPGSPNTIAVSRMNKNVTPKHAGVVIYDDNVMRPNTTPRHTGSNQIEFKNSTTMFGYNHESTGFDLFRLAVNAGGVSVVSESGGFPGTFEFFLDFAYHNDRIFYTNGKVVNVASEPFVSGQFANANGPVVYDTHKNFVAYASFSDSGSIRFKRFDPVTYLIQDDVAINQAFGEVKSIISCGYGCYAFNSSDNKVVIINDGTMGTENLNASKLKLYPNPASDFIMIEGLNQIESVRISDLNGRIISTSTQNQNKINLSGLEKGIYILTIQSNGKTVQQKFIKK